MTAALWVMVIPTNNVTYASEAKDTELTKPLFVNSVNQQRQVPLQLFGVALNMLLQQRGALQRGTLGRIEGEPLSWAHSVRTKAQTRSLSFETAAHSQLPFSG